MGKKAAMIIEIEVDDKGSPKIRNLGELASKTADRIDRGNRKAASGYSVLEGRIRSAKKSLAAFAAGYISLQGARALVSIADEYTMIDAKINLGTKSQEQFNQVYERLYALGRETGSQLVVNAQAFSKLALSGEYQVQELLRSQEILNKSMVVSGATTAENASFMLQYAQAMGSGVVNGDELRSMNEANAYIMQKVGDELGIGIAGLKEWGAEGKLTAELFFNALLKVGDEVDAQFDSMPVTVGRAMNSLREVFKRVIGDGNAATGATTSLAGAITDLADTIEANRGSITGLFTDIVEGAAQGIDTVMRFRNTFIAFKDLAWNKISVGDYLSLTPEQQRVYPEIRTELSMIHDLTRRINGEGSGFPFTDKRQQWKADLPEMEAAVEALRARIEKKISLSVTVQPEPAKSLEDVQHSDPEVKDLSGVSGGELERALARFEDAYLKATLTTTDYELAKLDQLYHDYAAHVTDKARLDAWYMAEWTRINDEQVEAEQARIGAVEADLDRMFQEEARASSEAAAALAAAYREVVGDLEGIRPRLAFDMRFEALEEQARSYLETGLAPELVSAWQAQMQNLLQREQTLASDDFFGGLSVGLEQSLADMQTWGEAAAGIANDVFTGMTDALSAFVMTGKLDVADLANAIIEQLVRITIQTQIVQPLLTGLFGGGGGGLFGGLLGSVFSSAQGNVVSGISTYSNSIVSAPTFAPGATRIAAYAAGGAVFGEAGPEAILPLTRMSGGELGVKAAGTPALPPQITVNIHEAAGTQTTVEQSDDGMTLDIIVEQVEHAMSGRMSRGAGLSPFLDSRYRRQ